MTKEEFENFCKCYFMPFSVDRQQAFFIGEQYGLTKADVMTIRKMAGFSSLNIKPKLTPAQREKMVREYERGKISLHNLAKKYGVSRVCVWYWVKRSMGAGNV
jgi:hypothetical protein